MSNIYLPAIIGKGYKEFWNSKERIRLLMGGRASKKSTTMSLWIIYHMMKLPLSNTLVLRRFYNTHRNSTFEQLLWAINKLEVKHLWKAILNPLELTYIPTGQKILFRG